jgi:hypothetical protein
MGRQRDLGHGSAVVVSAVTGVVLGHALAYLLVLPQADHRLETMRVTGHGYWTGGVALAVAAAVVALGCAVGDGLRRATGRRTPAPGLRSRWIGVAAIQLALFAGMETTERLLAGAPVTSLWRERLFLVGLALQVVVAGVAVLVLAAVARAAETVVSLRRRRPRSVRPSFTLRPPVVAVPSGWWRSTDCRGPPRRHSR